MELIILLAIAILIMLYRNYEGQNVGRFINDQVTVLYDKLAPYSFKKVREKTKELGQELSPRQYIMQAVFLGAFAGVISYLYFYNLVVSIIYVLGAVALVPYLSEYIQNLYLNKFKYIQVTLLWNLQQHNHL